MFKRILILGIVALALAIPVTSSAGGYHPHRVTLCYQDETINVLPQFVHFYLWLGATRGACPEPEPEPEPELILIQINRTGYCMAYDVLRVADNSWGRFVDLALTPEDILYNPLYTGAVPANVDPDTGAQSC